MARTSNRLNMAPVDRKLRRSIRKTSRLESNRVLPAPKARKKNAVTVENQSSKAKSKSQPRRGNIKPKRLIRPIKTGTESNDVRNRRKKISNKLQLDVTHMTKSKRKTSTPRINVTQYRTDPFFEPIGKSPVPFVSFSNYSKSSIRAVLTGDENLLKKLRVDRDNVHSLHVRKSIDVNFDALTYALAGNKVNLAKILLDDLNNPITDRVHVARSLITRQETGQYNFHMLGHAVRQIQMSRRGKEGTNAFLKDDEETRQLCAREILEKSIRYGLEMNTINRLLADDTLQSFAGGYLAQTPVIAVRWGRRKLAAQLIERFAKSYFNELAVETLTNDRDKPLKDFKAVSVKKKAMLNQFITPVHCAAINPNVRYIKDLLAVEPEFNHADTDGYKPIHYAAVNESSSVLSYLLEKGASFYDATKRNGFTPLHLACEANRPENVRVICQYVSRVAPENLLIIIRRKTKDEGFNVVHLAARQGYVKVLQVLRDCVSTDEKFYDDRSTAIKSNATPLMIAAQQGQLAALRYLYEECNCAIDARDKLKRTALMYAAMNGQSVVVSYLLRLGVNCDAVDSSGNTAAHYAAAYGWYFCLKLLIEAGADLAKSNDWLLSPLSVAYMKGHTTLADMILEQTNIDINCKDSEGLTLVALTIVSGINQSTLGQLDYLISKKHADVNLKDARGNNVFHHLATASFTLEQAAGETEEEYEQRQSELRLEVARILRIADCDPHTQNDDDKSPFDLAIENGHLDLALYFMEESSPKEFSSANKQPTHNILQSLIKFGEKEIALEIFDLLTKSRKKYVEFCLKWPNEEGATPFLSLCKYYTSLSKAADRKFCQKFAEAVLRFQPSVVQQCFKIDTFDRDRNIENNEVSSNANSADEEDETEKESNQLNENECAHDEKSLDQSDDFSDVSIGIDAAKFTVLLNESNENAFHILAEQPIAGETSPDETDSAFLIRYLLNFARNVEFEKNSSFNDLLSSIDRDGRSPLYKAVYYNNLPLVRLFVDYGADVNFFRRHVLKKGEKVDSSSPIGDSILIAAVKKKFLPIIKILLKKGVNLAHADSHGNTAFHYACARPDCTEIVKFFLSADCPFLPNCMGRYPSHLICNADSAKADDSIETLEELLSSNLAVHQFDKRGRLPLHYAFVKIGRHKDKYFADPVAVVTALTRHMKNLNFDRRSFKDHFGRTPLHYAAYRGANISCLILLSFKNNSRHDGDQCFFDVNEKDNDENMPFGLALQNGHYACALTLLQSMCDFLGTVRLERDKMMTKEEYEKYNKYRWIAAITAFEEKEVVSLPRLVVRQNWQGILYLMVQQLTNGNNRSIDVLLDAALCEKKYNLASTILRQIDPMLLNQCYAADKLTKNPLQILADTATADYEPDLQVKIAQLFIDKFKIDLDKQGQSWESCHVAFYAARRRNFVLLNFIGENTKCKLTELQALDDGHTVGTSFFISNDEFPVESKQFVNFMNTHHFDFDTVASYPAPIDLTKSEFSTQNVDHPTMTTKITALIRAVQLQKFKLVKWLLKFGNCDVNAHDSDRIYPLMHAITVNNVHLIKVLLNFEYNMEDNIQTEIMNEQQNSAEKDDLHAPEYNLNVFGTKRRLSSFSRPYSSNSLSKKKKRKVAVVSKFEITSPIDLNVRDKNGLNIFDYFLESLPYGAWRNLDIFRLIANNCDFSKFRHTSLTDIRDRAYEKGLDFLASEIEATFLDGLYDVSKVRRLKFWTDEDEKFQVYEKKIEELKIDVEGDARRYAENMKKRSTKGQKDQKDNIPYHLSGMSENGRILLDADRNRLFDVMLTKMDHPGPYGFYNFYRMQLIQEKGRDLYILFTNWGRMGDHREGQYQKTSFTKMADGVKEFSSVFRQKTGNEWSTMTDFSEFEIKSGKYRLILKDVESEREDLENATGLKLDIPKNLACCLPEELKLLVSDLTDFERVRKAAGRSINRQSRSFNFPLVVSSLKRECILHAKKILEQLGVLIAKLLDARKKLSSINVSRNVKSGTAQEKQIIDGCTQIYEQICQSSCEFYHLLPLKGFEHSKVVMIDDPTTLDEYVTLVNNLLEYEAGDRILKAASVNFETKSSALHPYEYVFKALNCRMKVLNPKIWECQHILHYVYNTAPDCAINAVLKIFDQEKDVKFNPKNLSNRKLLWHGTGVENLAGILTQGLMPAPFQADQTGQLFGKGIYTADTFDKSMNYCSRGTSRTMYMLLCEVALGRYKECTQDIQSHKADVLKYGFHSVVGLGRSFPDPVYDLALPTGAIIPLGQLKEWPEDDDRYFFLNRNEFVVYDPSQIVVRYIVAFSRNR